jgi:membrane-bound lytic murein transglycosylase D
MIARGERYLFHIVEEVEKRRMPSEIALLPMIESAYNPTAYSRAHASGIWQFIPSTGKTYGLRQNWWQDERRDVLAATRAALDYLEKLYEMFGSWELALASYNWGEGAVGRAVQRNESRGMRADYLSLDMPAETRNYIPKLMAVKNLVARPDAFGLTLADIPNRPYFVVVTTDRHIDVKLAAQLADMSVDEFLALNPSHNRPVIRAESSQAILLPADRAERFQAKLQAHSEPLVSWQPYTIERQDSIEKIGARFGIPASQLREVNGLSPAIRNLAGLTILVPATTARSELDVAAAGFATPSATAKTAAQAPLKYVVRSGDTLGSIASRFGLSAAALATRNGIRNGRVLAGQTLTIEGASSAQAAATAHSAQVTNTAAKPARAGKATVQAKKGTDGKVRVGYSARRD